MREFFSKDRCAPKKKSRLRRKVTPPIIHSTQKKSRLRRKFTTPHSQYAKKLRRRREWGRTYPNFFRESQTQSAPSVHIEAL